MTKEIEQGLHEKLCAYVLGEASDESRAEVEAALAQSAELRAERERIERTIGLVQATMGEGESLPPSAAQEILAEARPRASRPWYAQSSFRMAAGIAGAALVGVIGFRAMKDASGRHQLPATNVRKLDRDGGFQDRRPAPETAPMPAPAAPAAGEKLAFGEDAKREQEVRASETLLTSRVEAQQQSTLTVESLDRIDQATAAGMPSEEKVLLTQIDRSQATAPTSGGAELSDPADGADLSLGEPAGGTSGHYGRGRPSAFGARRTTGPSTAPPPAAGLPAPGAEKSARLVDAFVGTRVVPPAERKDETLNQMGYAAPEQSLGALRGLGYVDQDFDEGQVEGVYTGIITGSDDFFLGAGEKNKARDSWEHLRSLAPEDRERWLDLECRRIVERCRRRPNERPRDMFFRFWGDNAFELAALDPLSTFSVDVDTASYALARRYLNEGHIPTKAQVRTEEFVNYFSADVPAPKEGLFAIHTDLAPSRFSSDRERSMLRVVVRGKEVAKEERKPVRVTFVIDVSGSMKEQNRLELVKHAMRLLVQELGANDSIAIVAFSSDARMILPMTSAAQKGVVESAIHPLSPDGSTNAAAGLRMGYEEALAKIDANAENRVVLLSDGVANTGTTDQATMTESVRLHRERGIYLNTIGVGMNNHNDALLEQLADKGDGVCAYVDSPDEARKAIVERFTGAFVTIARDVKVQVEFDPAQVQAYRLLGYENRAVADKDFRNDAVDAGEVGAGHQVTALYEIERTGAASEKPLATVRLRWKAPRDPKAPTANEEASEISKAVAVAQQTGFEGAGVGFRRAAVAAQFAEFLRRSVHARGDSLDALIADADALAKETGDPETVELALLMHKGKQLILNALPRCDDLCQAIDAVRRNALLRCQEELLAKETDAKLLDDLEAENRRLEERLRELLRRKLETSDR